MRIDKTVLLLVGLSSAAAQAQHNQLTQAETDAGYQRLFNGRDLTGFRTYHSALPSSNWTVTAESSGNVIKITDTVGGFQPLISEDTAFLNFDLKVEWRVPYSGNSGIFIHYQYINEWAGASGPEAQVVDINHPDGTTPLHRAGTDYDMFPLIAGRLVRNTERLVGNWGIDLNVAPQHFNDRIILTIKI